MELVAGRLLVALGCENADHSASPFDWMELSASEKTNSLKESAACSGAGDGAPPRAAGAVRCRRRRPRLFS
jgi:hypothetical protein